MAKIAAERINAIIPADTDFAAPLPTTSTADSYLNNNCCFTAAGTGPSSGVSFAPSSAAPSGCRMLGRNHDGLSVEVTTTPLGGDKGNALNIRVTGTPTADGLVTLDQLNSAAAKMASVDLGTDVLRMVFRSKLLIVSGRVNVLQPILQASQDGAYGNRGVAAGAGDGGVYPYVYGTQFYSLHRNAYADNSHDWLTETTPDIDLRGRTSGAPTGLAPSYTLAWLPGEPLDVTLSLSQIGVMKVAG